MWRKAAQAQWGKLHSQIEVNVNGESYVASYNRPIYAKMKIYNDLISFVTHKEVEAEGIDTYWRDG